MSTPATQPANIKTAVSQAANATKPIPPAEVPRLAYSVDETAAMLAVGRDAIFDLIRTNRLRTFKIGARRLVALRDIETFLEKAPADTEAS